MPLTPGQSDVSSFISTHSARSRGIGYVWYMSCWQDGCTVGIDDQPSPPGTPGYKATELLLPYGLAGYDSMFELLKLHATNKPPAGTSKIEVLYDSATSTILEVKMNI